MTGDRTGGRRRGRPASPAAERLQTALRAMQLEADAKRDAAKPRRRRDDPEHQLQCLAIQWVALRTGRYPELELLHAIPNAARRTKRERGR
ncbi:MAG TPA: hypothetical protein VD838_05955, partial [Anaeromyxobacteraceae bacterium]|nr:hypothetical protein [Anaeromyxobacteraceae bacterium]